jgi:hypothetical protein
MNTLNKMFGIGILILLFYVVYQYQKRANAKLAAMQQATLAQINANAKVAEGNTWAGMIGSFSSEVNNGLKIIGDWF